MNSRERVIALLEGRPVDHLPLMPITMMFAVDQIGKKYCEYATDYRVLADAQVLTAETFDFDHVSAIAETREAPDCGAVVEYFDDQPPSVVESKALLADKSQLGVDRQIASIRQRLAERFGNDFDFYDTDGVRALWRPFDDPWNGLIYWASRFHERPDFDREERDYKFDIVRNLTAARDAVRPAERLLRPERAVRVDEEPGVAPGGRAGGV